MTNPANVPDQTGAGSDGIDRRRLLRNAAALAAMFMTASQSLYAVYVETQGAHNC